MIADHKGAFLKESCSVIRRSFITREIVKELDIDIVKTISETLVTRDKKRDLQICQTRKLNKTENVARQNAIFRTIFFEAENCR